MLDSIRSKAYEALRSSAGNQFFPVRFSRGVLNFVNDMMGRPLAPESEIHERREYERRRQQRLLEARQKKAADAHAASGPAGANGAGKKREPAPVVIYTDAQSHRDMKRIKDVFRGREIPFQELSVVEDEPTRSWVQTTAKTREFPVVFIAGQPVGGFDQLVQLDVKGELVRMVFGP